MTPRILPFLDDELPMPATDRVPRNDGRVWIRSRLPSRLARTAKPALFVIGSRYRRPRNSAFRI